MPHFIMTVDQEEIIPSSPHFPPRILRQRVLFQSETSRESASDDDDSSIDWDNTSDPDDQDYKPVSAVVHSLSHISHPMSQSSVSSDETFLQECRKNGIQLNDPAAKTVHTVRLDIGSGSEMNPPIARLASDATIHVIPFGRPSKVATSSHHRYVGKRARCQKCGGLTKMVAIDGTVENNAHEKSCWDCPEDSDRVVTDSETSYGENDSDSNSNA